MRTFLKGFHKKNVWGMRAVGSIHRPIYCNLTEFEKINKNFKKLKLNLNNALKHENFFERLP